MICLNTKNSQVILSKIGFILQANILHLLDISDFNQLYSYYKIEPFPAYLGCFFGIK